MTSASADQRRIHNRTYYENNKADRLRRNQEAREIAAAYVATTKRNKPCLDCGGTFHPVCMDYDHVRGKKTMNVSQAASAGMSLARIDEEIAKCELVCANCHRLRTFNIQADS